jgi:hypothetical protein
MNDTADSTITATPQPLALTALGTLAAWQERAQTRLLIDDHSRTCPECGLVRPDWDAIEAKRALEARS